MKEHSEIHRRRCVDCLEIGYCLCCGCLVRLSNSTLRNRLQRYQSNLVENIRLLEDRLHLEDRHHLEDRLHLDHHSRETEHDRRCHVLR